MSKRLFDLALAGAGLILGSPILLLAAVLIKIDSRGPVFFTHERAGRNGRPFRIIKLRTMVQDARLIGPRLTQKRDPRVTRIGQILRWLKLDELPQLVNVLRGEMSLVGPRPEDPHFVRYYTPEQRAVLSVRPGIMGPSQAEGRDELEKYPDAPVDVERYYVENILPGKLAIDLAYVRRHRLVGDLRVIGACLRATLGGAFKGEFLRLRRPQIALLGLDTLASLAVYHLAYGLKHGWPLNHAEVPYAVAVSALIVLVCPPLFVYFGLYQHLLRYLGVREFLAVVKAVSVGMVLIVSLTFMLGFQGHSRLVFLIQWPLLIVALFGLRVARKTWTESAVRDTGQKTRNVLIVGAGDSAEQLVRAMIDDEARSYRPVGFVDDDPSKHGVAIHGVRVLGRVGDIAQVALLERVELVVIVFPHVSPASLAALIDHCRRHDLEYRLVPTLGRLLQGGVFLPEFRELGIREPLAPGAGGNGTGAHGDTRLSRVAGARCPPVRPRSRGRGDRPVLVTGGAGYVGCHVVGALLARGRHVRVIDSFLYGSAGLHRSAGDPRLELIEGDIRHLRTMAQAVKDVDSVIALAALVGDAACELDVDETLSTNLEATRLLSEVCERAGVRRLVFASSCSVYGANSELTLNEGSWLNPVSLYAKTRIRSEEYLLRRKHRLSVTVLRLATVFGVSPRMRFDLVVNTFAAHGYFQRKIRVFGGGQCRPNVHVRDAAEAFVLAAEAADEKVRGEIFNVGHGALNYTVLEMARLVQGVLPDVEVEVVDAVADERNYRVSFEKVGHGLGLHAGRTVEGGIREIVAAFESGEITSPALPEYHNARYLQAHGFPGPLVGRGRPLGAGASS
jgi:lipopolysaccharide/colanic/teichoic acid biosynthesis glycosyltransferase/nucleoside-diphosphate-sugar epimerase